MNRDSAIAKFGVRFFLKDEQQPFMTVHPRFDNASDARDFAHHVLKDDILGAGTEQVNIFQEVPCVLRVRQRQGEPV